MSVLCVCACVTCACLHACMCSVCVCVCVYVCVLGGGGGCVGMSLWYRHHLYTSINLLECSNSHSPPEIDVPHNRGCIKVPTFYSTVCMSVCRTCADVVPIFVVWSKLFMLGCLGIVHILWQLYLATSGERTQ